MILQPCAPWLILTLAVVLLGDALLMLRPPSFIVTCLTGVGFPREWWWALIVIKILAAAGLVAACGSRASPRPPSSASCATSCAPLPLTCARSSRGWPPPGCRA